MRFSPAQSVRVCFYVIQSRARACGSWQTIRLAYATELRIVPACRRTHTRMPITTASSPCQTNICWHARARARSCLKFRAFPTFGTCAYVHGIVYHPLSTTPQPPPRNRRVAAVYFLFWAAGSCSCRWCRKHRNTISRRSRRVVYVGLCVCACVCTGEYGSRAVVGKLSYT